jgi:hypothetical protein
MDSRDEATEKTADVDADPATSIDQSDGEDEKIGGFIFGNVLESNDADATLPEQEQERVVDLVRLQPTKNAEIQEEWGLNDGSEAHKYLESELKEYYYRDGDGYIRATDAAEELAQNHQELYQDVTRPEDDPEEEPDLQRRDLLIALVTLTQELGHLPSAENINDHGEYAHQRYKVEFGDLYTAYQEAGLLPDDMTRADFYDEETAPPDPTAEEGSEGEVEEPNLEQVPESDTDLEQAEEEGEEEASEPSDGEDDADEPVEINISNRNVDRPDFEVPDNYGVDDLISEIQRFAKLLNEPPTEELVTAYGPFSSEDYRDAFESWTAALETAGRDPDNLPDWSRRGYTNVEILDVIRIVANEFGRPPTTIETGKRAEFSYGLGSVRFGSWAATLETAGLDPSERPGVDVNKSVEVDSGDDSGGTDLEDGDDEGDDDQIGSLIDDTLENMLMCDDEDGGTL